MSSKGRWGLALLALVVLAGSACSKSSSGGGDTGAPTTGAVQTSGGPATQAPSPTSAANASGDLSGTWSGSWTNTSPDNSSGTFTLTWAENGSNLKGAITVDGAGCLTKGSIAGSLSGDHISFGVVSGQAQVQYSGQVKGYSMSGTYSTSIACADAKGTWEASKTG